MSVPVLGNLAVLGFTLSGFLGEPAVAQCDGDIVVHQHVDTPGARIRLTTPDGAAVVGGPFSLQVRDAPRRSHGFLTWTLESPSTGTGSLVPDLGGLPFQSPINVLQFQTGRRGISTPLLVTSEVDAGACGEQLVFQAFVVHWRSGNIVSSGRLRVRVGEPGTLFSPTVNAPNDVEALGVADLNEDGILDLVHTSGGQAQASTGRLWTNLGQAAGGYALPVETTLAPNLPDDLAIGDLNGDGAPDVVTANVQEDTISVLLGDGGGGFGAETQFATALSPNDINAGDVNNDGDLDIVVAPRSTSAIWIHNGNGMGGFDTGIVLPTSTPPGDALVADLDENGISDVAGTLLLANEVVVFLGQGFGIFGSPDIYDVGERPHALAVADVDGDTIPDVVTLDRRFETVTFGTDGFSVLSGLGNGALSPAVSHATSILPRGLTVEDFDDDGEFDVVVVGDDTSVHLSDGSGGFARRSFAASGRHVRVADSNADGRMDVVVGSSELVTILGRGDGTIAAPLPFPDPVPDFTVTDVEVADMNRDGRLDVVAGAGFEDRLWVLLGKGDGTFQQPLEYTEEHALEVRVADFDEDGVLDVLVSSGDSFFSGTEAHRILPGVGDGSLGPGFDVAFGETYDPILTDVESNGVVDVVMRRSGPGPPGIEVFLGNGDGTFGPPLVTNLGVALRPEVGDLNADGNPDIVLADDFNDEFIILLGDGGGGFPPFTVISEEPGSLAVVDLDEDGFLDIVTSRSGPTLFQHELGVLFGNGDGTFQAPGFLPSEGYLNYMLPADFDGDGDLDIAWPVEFRTAADAAVQGLEILENLGTRTFAPRRPLYGRLEDADEVADMDRDGIPDIVALDSVILSFLGE